MIATPKAPQLILPHSCVGVGSLPAVEKVYAPVTLSDEFLSGRLDPHERRYIDQILVLVHLVILRRLLDKRYQHGDMVPLKAEYAREIIGRKDWKACKDICTRHGIIEIGHYLKGKHSTLFQLGDEHSKAPWHQVPVEDKAVARRLRRWRDYEDRQFWEKARRLRRVRTFQALLRHRDGLTLDRTDIAALCRGMESELREAHKHSKAPDETSNELDLDQLIIHHEAAAQRIRNREWQKTICNYGRYHWNVTSLWRPLRMRLRFDGQSLVNIDVKTSQMLFFCLLMMSEG